MLIVTTFFRRRFLRSWASAIILLGLMLISSAQANTLSEGQSFMLKDGTQVVFNLDTKVMPKVQILHNPQRLVIDLPNTQLGRLNPGLEQSPDIQKLRVGQNGNTLRIVFDLTGQYHGRAAIIKDSRYRLVADIFRNVPNTPTRQPRAIDLAAANIAPTPPTPNKAPTVNPNANTEQGWAAANQSVAATDKPANTAQPKPEPIKPTTAAPAKTNPTTPVTPYRRHQVRVIIDPGHGGRDPGAIGPTGIKEKDVVLAIGKKLAALINSDDSMVAIMTRSDDTFRKLYSRVSFAREQKGDIFISLHANAVPKSSPKTQRGALVFILNRSGATSKLAKYLEESENAAGKIGGQDIIQVDEDVRDLVYGMVQGAVIDESRILASHILKQMKGANNVFKYAVEGANFAVLSAPDVPSVLVETTFISTPSEEKKLNQKAYQNKMAEAIYKGIAGFVQQRQHLTWEE